MPSSWMVSVRSRELTELLSCSVVQVRRFSIGPKLFMLLLMCSYGAFSSTMMSASSMSLLENRLYGRNRSSVSLW